MRALVVDDSKIMRLMVRKQLHGCGIADTDIVEAEDGRQALEHVRAAAPDIVLSDVNMPVMDGEQLLYGLHDDAFFDRGRCVMVTSRYERRLFRRLFDHGASAIIRKPFTAEAFRRQLEPVLQEISDARGGNATLRSLPLSRPPEDPEAPSRAPITVEPGDDPTTVAAKSTGQVLRTLGLPATLEPLEAPVGELALSEIVIHGPPEQHLVLYGDPAACSAFSLHTIGLPADTHESRADVMGEVANIVAGHWLATIRPHGVQGFDPPRTGQVEAADVVWEGLAAVRLGEGHLFVGLH
jgi:two-component system, chemotaxis family, chemotaxis protein CheY